MTPGAWLEADWPAPPGVRALTTLRGGLGHSQPPFDRLNLGLNSGDDPGVVERNRAALVQAAGLPSPPRWLKQVHGIDVARVDALDVAVVPVADAAVTTVPGTVLAILTADCLPVVFASLEGDAIGAAHAGWRGLAAGVLEATVAAMPVAPRHLRAWLGPAAGPQAYEIGEEVRDAFVGLDSGAPVAFVSTRPGHWHVDLYALARRRLATLGITDVHGGTHCTISAPDAFFSHRRDQHTGRMATLAWIAPRG